LFRFLELFRVRHYLIIICPKCGGIRYCRSDQKWASCSYCGKTFQIRNPKGNPKVSILHRIDRVEKARDFVSLLKLRRYVRDDEFRKIVKRILTYRRVG